MIKLYVFNEGNFTADEILRASSAQFLYGWKVISLTPAAGEMYDFIMIVKH